MVPMVLVLLLFSSTAVFAEETADPDHGNGNHPGKSWKFLTHAQDLIKGLMEKFGLTESNTIGDLLSAIQTEQDQNTQEAMDHFGVSTTEDLQAAIQSQNVENIRERLGLDASLTDEEVLAAAKEAREAKVRELLGLSTDASQEEVKQAMQTWREENWALLHGPRGHNHR